MSTQISQASPAMADALMRLWQCVFGDPKAYIELFFAHRFVPEQTMVAVEDGKPVSMLFLLPLALCAGQSRYDARYVYAVATHPDYRKQGLSGALLAETHRMLSAKGVEVSLLVPASEGLFGYYAARGYRTEFHVENRAYLAEGDGETPKLTVTSMAQCAQLRDTYFADSALYARWDAAALSYQDREAALLGGQVLSFAAPQPGYALCYPTPGAVVVKELAAPQEDGDILNAIARYYSCRRVLVRRCAPKGATPFAMTCWYTNPPKRKESGDLMAPYLSLVLD